MKSEEFTLKSGTRLMVTMAAFELAVSLKEAVDDVMLHVDPATDETDPRLNFLIISNERVRKAAFACADTALYGSDRVTPGLFNDPKIGVTARGDYHDIMTAIIKVNRGPFFLNRSSESITPQKSPSANPESQ